MYTKNQKTEESKWENLLQLEEALLSSASECSFYLQSVVTGQQKTFSSMMKSWEAIQFQMIYYQVQTSTGHPT